MSDNLLPFSLHFTHMFGAEKKEKFLAAHANPTPLSSSLLLSLTTPVQPPLLGLACIAFSSLLLYACVHVCKEDPWTKKKRKGEEGSSIFYKPQREQGAPNQQRNLNKLPPELRCRNFVTKHRLSVQIGTKSAKMCMKCVHIPTDGASILHTTVRGWAGGGGRMEEGCKKPCAEGSNDIS